MSAANAWRRLGAILLLALAAAFLPGGQSLAADGGAFDARVLSVVGGDQLLIERRSDGARLHIHLAALAAPAAGEAAAVEAQAVLGELTRARPVAVLGMSLRPRGGFAALVFTGAHAVVCREHDCPGGTDLGLALLQRGLGWYQAAGQHALGAVRGQEYARAESMARLRRLGLWRAPNPQAPWPGGRR